MIELNSEFVRSIPEGLVQSLALVDKMGPIVGDCSNEEFPLGFVLADQGRFSLSESCHELFSHFPNSVEEFFLLVDCSPDEVVAFCIADVRMNLVESLLEFPGEVRLEPPDHVVEPAKLLADEGFEVVKFLRLEGGKFGLPFNGRFVVALFLNFDLLLKGLLLLSDRDRESGDSRFNE